MLRAIRFRLQQKIFVECSFARNQSSFPDFSSKYMSRYQTLASSSDAASDDGNTGVEEIRKAELISVLAEKHRMNVIQADRILTTILDTIIENVAEGNNIKIRNFGKFEQLHWKGRTGVNPFSGESIIIPSRDRPGFRPFKTFKNRVNARCKKIELKS
mmetsp:Transcript_17417/g.20096  ORF Transcript_17417/g.20096 Transcript_17417/m.20096 type:complete len:158 (+) Transcript_17417:59-532(+)